MQIINKRGFTLIELLVVVAIIGLLASIVLVSVGTARNKAKDVAIKADLSNLRAAGELYSDTAGNYVGFCTSGDANRAKDGITSVSSAMQCNAGATAWSACANLIVNSSSGWCVDSTGIAKTIASASCNAASVQVCP